MHVESLEFKRCCFCLPLRRGLIGWGYVKLILDVLAAIRVSFDVVSILQLATPYPFPWDVAFVLAAAITVLIDTMFTVLLVSAAHKKNAKLLRISYIYNLVSLILILAFFAYITYLVIDLAIRRSKFSSHIWPRQAIVIDLLSTLGILYSIIFVQVYITLLTRSEAVKLRNQRLEVQFVSNAAESEARCVGAATEHNDAQDSDSTQDTEKNMEYKQDNVV